MAHKPENESINLLLNMVCKAQRVQMSDALTEIGVYAGQEMFLWQLWQHDGLTQSQLAERMCVAAPTISKMLDRMEKTGLVRRMADAEDNRVSHVYLTAEGRKVEQAVRDVWISMEGRITANFNAEERLLLRRLLLQLYQNLTGEQ